MLGDCLGVVVGDVSSHGMGPALLMSETRACLRTLAQVHTDVGEILTRANRLLAADADDFHFVTLAMARLDPRDRSMVYASAGQRGYLLRSGIEAIVLDSTSLPLGVRADTVVPAASSIMLQPGDLITFFTDGVAEAESPGRVRFGVARALQTIRSDRDKPAAEIIEVVAPAGFGILPQPASQRRRHDRGGEGDGVSNLPSPIGSRCRVRETHQFRFHGAFHAPYSFHGAFHAPYGLGFCTASFAPHLAGVAFLMAIAGS